MQSKRFALSFFSYGLLGVVWAGSIWLAAHLLANASGVLILSRDGLRLFLIIGLIFLPSILITWSFLVEMTTIYSTDGISRLTILGRRLISWYRIIAIERGLFALVILYQKKKYYIRLLMYRNPQEVIDYVESYYTNIEN